jgi:thiol-disulfide isomerase/thioredoxin
MIARRRDAVQCSRIVARIATLALLVVGSPARAGELLPFDAHSMQALRSEFSGRPFVVAFWSASCEPCREELAHWASVLPKHPEVPVVLVATDPPQDRAAVDAILARFDLGRSALRIFADEFAEKLRYTVDPKWRGEVPRSYFFDGRHRVEVKIGPVDSRWAERWFARAAATAR